MRKAIGHPARLALLALTLAACAAKNNGTLMVVNVESDLIVPTEIDSIRLDIVPDRGASRTQSLPLAATAAPGVYVLPVPVALIPDGAPALGFTVTATALLATQEVAHQTLTATFTAGQAQEFDLFISRACAGNQALCPDGAATPRAYGGASDGGTVTDAGTADVHPGTDTGPGTDARTDAGADGAVDRGGGDGSQPPAWMPTTGVAATTTLNSVWARPSDVWAVGNSKSAGQAWHFDGTSWTLSTVPAGTAVLYGVWAGGPNEVWAVGEFGTILHRGSGAAWTTVSSGVTTTLSGIWGNGADIWAVGAAGTILHWDGAAWGPVKSPTSQDLLSVTGDGGTDRWAVGVGGVIVQGSGTGWTSATSATQNVLYSVWANAANDVWAVGADGAFHFDGSKWVGTPGVSNPNAIWASGPTDVWAACVGGVVSHFTGSTWSSASAGTTQDLISVNGTGPTDVWVVGTMGTAQNYR